MLGIQYILLPTDAPGLFIRLQEYHIRSGRMNTEADVSGSARFITRQHDHYTNYLSVYLTRVRVFSHVHN